MQYQETSNLDFRTSKSGKWHRKSVQNLQIINFHTCIFFSYSNVAACLRTNGWPYTCHLCTWMFVNEISENGWNISSNTNQVTRSNVKYLLSLFVSDIDVTIKHSLYPMPVDNKTISNAGHVRRKVIAQYENWQR